MLGLIQDRPLLISSLIEYSGLNHGDVEIVSRTVEGPIHRTNYRNVNLRSKKLAQALGRLGVKLGDRIGTIAWNGYRHIEIYFGVSGMGAVCHTINPRLFPEQIAYIVNHAEDRFIFVDLTFLPLIEALKDHLSNVEGFIVMTDEENMPDSKLDNLLCYETLVGAEDGEYSWPDFDEKTASSLCYTSGTTGNPKGVLYANRSTVLHSFCVCAQDGLGVSNHDSILAVVPMFHANAWGLPYAAAMCGAKMVLPGAAMDGASLYELMEAEGVTLSAGVPTIWLMLLAYVKENKLKFSTMNRTVIGGSAAPRSMIATFVNDYGVNVVHAWGMTETSPIGTTGNLLKKHNELPESKKIDVRVKQGRLVYGVELKVTDDDNKELPRDGVAFGDLKVRGPWVTNGYFKGEGGNVLDKDGWFSTGDVGTLDPDGYMQITDRSKDVIKSGGEWISSIDVENEALGCPGIVEAAVIAIPHPKWDERPLVIAVKEKGHSVSREDVIRHLESTLAKWQLPDDVVFVDELPHTATGKLLKTKLREDFKDYKLPTA
ncbi:3-(methylthio)propionyl-CoA ligase [Sneathiella sp.]|uniref:3-(methylthio)propionyl-CoA ligase n=1 Tax=Sneathiella sp. TaxID=1964365 RepID=UPI0035629FCA